MHNYLVYLAGPISGIGYGDSMDWREIANERFYGTIRGLSPLRGKQYLNNETNMKSVYDEHLLSSQRTIYARDKFDCLRSDIILVNLLGAKTVSIGTCMEIAWGAQNNTPIVLIMEENNIHEHPMLSEACPFIVDNLDAGIVAVESILLP